MNENLGTGKDFRNFAVKHKGINGTVVDDVIKHISKSASAGVSGLYTPSIVEEREMNMVVMSVFDRLMKDRLLWVSGEVNDQMADIIQAQLLYLDSIEPLDITMYLNTPGGGVGAGLSMVDTMDFIASDVATTNLGMCASMGSVLLGAGTHGKRTGLITSKVMTHQVSYGAQGNIQDVRITQREAEKLNYILFRKLAGYTGQTLEEILAVSERDNWLNSDEAVKFGIMDSVIGLTDEDGNRIKGVLSVTEQLDGFDAYYDKILKEQK